MKASSKKTRCIAGDSFEQNWPEIYQPESKHCMIWRYMDLPKFAWMLFEGRLFMPSLRLLRKSDPFEGTTPEAVINILTADALARKRAAAGPLDIEHLTDTVAHALFVADVERLAQLAYITCWYQSDHASDAMWRLYGSSNNSVAIRSTYFKLKSALPDHVKMGMVTYEDFSTGGSFGHAAYSIFQKRKDFEPEREVRGVTFARTPIRKEIEAKTLGNGYAPDVDLTALIDDVYVSPLADDWFLSLVETLLAKSNLKVPVVRQTLEPMTEMPRVWRD